jgi:hypothetical protein
MTMRMRVTHERAVHVEQSNTAEPPMGYPQRSRHLLLPLMQTNGLFRAKSSIRLAARGRKGSHDPSPILSVAVMWKKVLCSTRFSPAEAKVG